LTHEPPSLLITGEGEAKMHAGIENILGKPIAAHSLVHQEGAIKVCLLASRPSTTPVCGNLVNYPQLLAGRRFDLVTAK